MSRRIAALEQQAGGPLFERLPRGVRLNPAGRALHRHAVEMLDRLAWAGRELAVLHAGHGGLLAGQAPRAADVPEDRPSHFVEAHQLLGY
ncbi:DNA-binding transcriptional LysR family regulator [Streptomyces sp. V1I1]|nr:DNA-binding transcriptional LysR family regulator [Streptomyces sp. V1I1]